MLEPNETNHKHELTSLPQLAAKINEAHAEAEAAIQAGLLRARTVGEMLLEAKAQLRHGEWLPWLAANVAFAETTARAYMRVARRWAELESKSATVADLTFRDGLQLLAAPKDDDEQSEPNQLEELPVEPIAPKSAFPLPDLDPAYEYFAWNATESQLMVVTPDPAGDPTGRQVWHLGHYQDIDTDSSFVDYPRRGMYLTKDILARMIRHYGFVAAGPWQTNPAPAEKPWFITAKGKPGRTDKQRQMAAMYGDGYGTRADGE